MTCEVAAVTRSETGATTLAETTSGRMAERVLPVDPLRGGSVAHQHLLAVINTELHRRAHPPGSTIAILDAGCGDGKLLAYLMQALPHCWPALSFTYDGFDVGDHGLQPHGYFRETHARLSALDGSRDWQNQLKLISEHDAWPYPSGTFDVVLSNQVLEHVGDHRAFFGEIARVLRSGGFSVHLFPLGSTILEWHLKIPFAHWFRSADVIEWWIALFVGWREWRRAPKLDDPAARRARVSAYARDHADFLVRLTNYVTQRELLDLIGPSRLHASFRYTSRYYAEKFRNMRGLPPPRSYPPISPPLSAAAAILLRYVAGVTLLLEKAAPYGIGVGETGRGDP